MGISPEHVELNLVEVRIRVEQIVTVLQLLVVSGVGLDLAEGARGFQPEKRSHSTLTSHHINQLVVQGPISEQFVDVESLSRAEVPASTRLKQLLHLFSFLGE